MWLVYKLSLFQISSVIFMFWKKKSICYVLYHVIPYQNHSALLLKFEVR